MSSISSLFSPPNLLPTPIKPKALPQSFSIQFLKPKIHISKPAFSPLISVPDVSRRLYVVAEDASAVATSPSEPSGEAARRVYIGNIPRNVKDDELAKIVGEHGAVERAEVMYDKYTKKSRRFAFVTMKTVEDANAVVEKLNGTEVGGREIKVNITEKPLTKVDMSLLQEDDSQFVDSPHKVYVGNLAKTVTTDMLKQYFSEKGNALSAKVSRIPGTSKSTGFGFVTFSSEEDVEAAISSYNNAELEGQKIRVNKA